MVLQKLFFYLIDEELEFKVYDRRSFEEFVGLGVINDIPTLLPVPKNNAKAAIKTRTLRQDNCLRDGIRIQIDCSRGI